MAPIATYRRLALWGTPVAVAVVLALSAANYRATERTAIDGFQRRQLAWTRTVAVGVEGNVARHESSLTHLGSLPSIQYITVDFLGARLAQFFSARQRTGVLEVVRVDARQQARRWHPDGRLVSATPDGWRDDAIWAWNTDPGHRGNLRAWTRVESGAHRLVLTLPIYQTAASELYPVPTGQYNGFVALAIDPDSVVGPFAQSIFDTLPGASLAVVDSEGRLVWGGGRRVEPLLGRGSSAEAFDATAEYGQVETPDGTMFLTTVPIAAGQDSWRIWLAVPRALATADVQRTFRRQLLLFLLLLATTIAAGWALLRVAVSESRYRDLFEQAADGIFVVGSDGRIADVNAAGAALAARAPEALAGVPFTDVVAASDLAAWTQAAERVAPPQRVALPLTLVTPTGAVVATDASLSRGPAGRTLVILRDMRERRQLEAQLQQAQKMEAIGRLAGGVAHDFNNLLTAISGYNELIQESFHPDDARRGDTQQVRHATERATALTRQLLAFGRKQVLQPRVFVLNELVDSTQRLLRRLVGEHISIRPVLAPDLWAVEADPGQIEQVLVNLIVNARDAMASTGGVITIETANVATMPEGDAIATGPLPVPGVRVSVVDTGHGMPPETAAQMFEPFFTTKPIGTGTGLGLPTAYGIVRQSRGEIRVVTSPGGGSRFDVVLPRSTKPLSPAISAPQGSTVRDRVAGVVLLVEDDADVRGFAARALERLGYTVYTAEGGRAALDLLGDRGLRPDVVVTDLVMPEMNGVQLAATIRARYPGLPVLLTSGHSGDVLEAQGLSRPPGPTLAKPFSAEQLGAAVRSLLEGARTPPPPAPQS